MILTKQSISISNFNDVSMSILNIKYSFFHLFVEGYKQDFCSEIIFCIIFLYSHSKFLNVCFSVWFLELCHLRMLSYLFLYKIWYKNIIIQKSYFLTNIWDSQSTQNTQNNKKKHLHKNILLWKFSPLLTCTFCPKHQN